MTDHQTVLIIEDEADIQTLLRTVLTRNDFDVVVASDGVTGITLAAQHQPDLVLLDVGLPDIDGWGVLEHLRSSSNVPVIMLTAHGTEADRVRGLGAGADDYLVKPFSNKELIARIQAVLRRSQRIEAQQDLYSDATLTIDFVAKLVSVNDQLLKVTPIEYRLLSAFAKSPNLVLSVQQLLEAAWKSPPSDGQDRVKFSILRLRKKLGWSESGPIVAVRGFGYRYDPPLSSGPGEIPSSQIE
ncbi:MAG: response regulator transcription factor [Actinomycetota bacterium]